MVFKKYIADPVSIFELIGDTLVEKSYNPAYTITRDGQRFFYSLSQNSGRLAAAGVSVGNSNGEITAETQFHGDLHLDEDDIRDLVLELEDFYEASIGDAKIDALESTKGTKGGKKILSYSFFLDGKEISNVGDLVSHIKKKFQPRETNPK